MSSTVIVTPGLGLLDGGGGHHRGSAMLSSGRIEGGAGLTAESFDDGRTDVPAAWRGRSSACVVVGAGIAGLTVANALAMAGSSAWCWRPATGSAAGCTRLTWRARRSIWAGRGSTRRSGTRCGPSPSRPACPAAARNPLPELAGFDCGEGRRLSAAEVEANLAL